MVKFRGLGLRVRSLGALLGLGAAFVVYATVLTLAFGFYFDLTDALAAMISTGAGATAAGRFARTRTATPMKRPGVTA